MRKIIIHEEVRTDADMVDVLNRIVELIEGGYTSGYYPGWDLQGEEEPRTEDEDIEEPAWTAIGHTHPIPHNDGNA
jgi:hypothetical protein